MEKLSKDDEARILRALEDSVGLVNGGVVPNDAIHKVAEANKFLPPIVQRMVEAFNVSKTLSHMKTVNGFERAASFPLANTAEILGRMFPEKVLSQAEKQSAADVPLSLNLHERMDFMSIKREVMPPALKVAEYPRDSQLESHRIFNRRGALLAKVADAKSEYRLGYARVWGKAQQAANHFKYLTHEPFAEVEKRATANYGATGKICMDLIHSLGSPAIKRAEGPPAGEMVFSLNREPYRSIHDLHVAALELYKKAERVVDAEVELDCFEKKSGLREEEPATLLGSVLSGEPSRPFEKGAFDVLPSGFSSTPELAASALGFKSGPLSPETQDKALSDVLDPQHEALLQSANVKAMLNDFISNDPILSSYDPSDVSNAYNQISQLAPSVASQPTVMRGMLRKMLQQEGVMEPFEAHQSAQIEQQLRRLQDVPGSGAAKGGGE